MNELSDLELEELVADLESPDLFYTLSNPQKSLMKVIKSAGKQEDLKKAIDFFEWADSLLGTSLDIEEERSK